MNKREELRDAFSRAMEQFITEVRALGIENAIVEELEGETVGVYLLIDSLGDEGGAE